MHSRVAPRPTLRIAVALTICVALLPIPSISFLVTGAAQSQGDSAERKVKPRPGKPEGELPDFENIKNESQLEREAAPPIPSTLRSPKHSAKPWDGRRVGDPETLQPQLDQAAVIEKQTRRAHARKRIKSPPPLIYEDQFIQNFFSFALLRSATYEETLYWNYLLRAAYYQSQLSLKLGAVELGKTLFESASYAARNRDNHWYVYDLYKTFLMREPDASGWAFWESQVPLNGRENVRRALKKRENSQLYWAPSCPAGRPVQALLH